MNKNVNPLLALAIIVVFGGLLGMKFYFYDKALDVPKVQFIKTSSDSSISIRLGSQLFDYSSEGKLNKVIDLKALGITGDMGDFDFFSNGDLLINSDEYIANLTENLKSYARLENTNTASAKAERGLFRCDLLKQNCQVFNNTIPELQGAHYLHIDRITDNVYLADTTRHEIRKLSSTGELLAEIKIGLKFPNQVYLEGDKLWVVDTNHHVMKALNPKTDRFGEQIEEHRTVAQEQWVWPSAFTRVGESWWVNIADNAMQKAKVVIFDKDWNRQDELLLPQSADPVTSQSLGDKVIIADASNYVLYQFDNSGFRLADFAQGALTKLLKVNKAQDEKYRSWSEWTLWLLIALFIPMFIYAALKSKKDQEEEKVEQLENATEIEMDKIIQLAKLPLSGEWLEAKPIFKYIQWIVVGLVLSMGIAMYSIFGLFSASEKQMPVDIFIILAFIPALIVLLLVPMTKISRYKIGFLKTNVTIETDKGKLISAPYDEIQWNPRAFIINGWFVPIGNANKSVFPYKKIQQRLMPYLSSDNKLGEIEFMKRQWDSPEGTLKYAVMAGVLAVSLVIYLERVKILAFFS